MSLILALLAAVPQVQARAPSGTRPLSPAAEAAVAAWRAKTAPCRARATTIPAGATVAVSLAARVETDQCLRRSLDDPGLDALPAADRDAAMRRVYGEVAALDAANTAYVKSVLPADGWFRASRDGRQTARDAWLIVQHSSDQTFQQVVVARMAPLAAAGEVEGKDYALLHDRTEMFAGRPQFYGSQYQCANGRWSLSPLRDPAGVEARRKAFGMDTLADNLAKLTANGGCGAPVAARTGAAAVATDPAAARAVVERYYAAIGRGDFRTAYRLWGGAGQRSGQGYAAFARGFARTARVAVTAGASREQEGAAGSIFITVPVEVRARLKSGRHQRFRGTYVLRRVNGVDGASPAQLAWHIERASLREVR